MLKHLNKQQKKPLMTDFPQCSGYPFLYTSSIQHLAMQIDYLKRRVLESRIAWKT